MWRLPVDHNLNGKLRQKHWGTSILLNFCPWKLWTNGVTGLLMCILKACLGTCLLTWSMPSSLLLKVTRVVNSQLGEECNQTHRHPCTQGMTHGSWPEHAPVPQVWQSSPVGGAGCQGGLGVDWVNPTSDGTFASLPQFHSILIPCPQMATTLLCSGVNCGK